MPLSEFLRMARGKIDSAQQRPSPLGFSRGEDEFLELVWENGQLMMQGQSSRATRNAFPSDTPKFREPATSSRIGKHGEVESMLNDLSPVVPSGDMDYSQDDDMVPWLNYSVDDALPNYFSDILPEISGLTGNGVSNQNSYASANKKNSCDGNGANGLKGSSTRPRLVSSWPQQVSDPSLVSGVSDIVSNNTSKHMLNGSTNMKMPSANSNLLNFSHFSRPGTLPKPDVPISDALPASAVSITERIEDKGKGLTFCGADPVKSRHVDPLNTTHRGLDFHGPSATLVGSSKALPVEGNDNLCQENSTKIHGDASKVVPDGEKSIEPLVSSSSVGSGNSVDRVSCEQTHNSKRKFQDLEESEFNCDDVDTESIGVKKPTSGRGSAGSKRSRAAEVHNLSERRRRDRINEKMRALQELIPNCNKADKASMLDEAIEYLKTLQLQVQMMSMGAGLCMPQMMFPSGIHPAHMPHYSPMGIGMGMGMGFGMGMPDMTAGSSPYPMFPVPQMQGAHFPSSMPGPVNFQRIPGPNLPMYVHPSQGLPSSLPLAPLAPKPTVTPTVGLSASRLGNQGELPGTSRTLDQDNAVASKNPQAMHNAEASGSIEHSSNQLQATNEVLNKSAAVEENKQPADIPGKVAQALTATATDVCKLTGGD